MNFFSSDAGVRTHVLAIEPGEYMLESIMALIERAGIRTGAVVSGIDAPLYFFQIACAQIGKQAALAEDLGVRAQSVAAIGDRSRVPAAGVNGIHRGLRFQTHNAVTRVHPLYVGLAIGRV